MRFHTLLLAKGVLFCTCTSSSSPSPPSSCSFFSHFQSIEVKGKGTKLGLICLSFLFAALFAAQGEENSQ